MDVRTELETVPSHHRAISVPKLMSDYMLMTNPNDNSKFMAASCNAGIGGVFSFSDSVVAS